MEIMVRRRRFKTTLKLFVFFFALCMLTGSLSAVRAAEGDPAKIKDVYEDIDGVYYYNTDTNCFSSNANQYFRELLGTGHSALAINGYNRSTADLWLQIAGGLFISKDYVNDKSYGAAMDMAACQGSNDYVVHLGPGSSVIAQRYPMSNMTSDDMRSLKDAEEYVYYTADINGRNTSTGYFKNDNKEQTVVAAIMKTRKGSDQRVAAVYFTNFKVVALFPEDDGKNYVTTVIKDKTVSSDAVASTVRNNTGVPATGSQTLSNSYSASLTSSVSGSETYTYSEGVNVSNEFASGLFNKFKVDVSFTASQAFQKGWEEAKGITESDGYDQSVSVSLPPYTNVMMIQKTTNADYITKYNCPVGITFDATVVIYDNNGVATGYSSGTANGNKMVFSFQGTARQSLGNRYKEWKTQGERADSEGIVWPYVTTYDNYAQAPTHIGDAIDKASTYVPVAPTGAEYRQKLKLVSGEIDGIMPIYPLKAIVVDSLNIPRYEDTGSYNSYNYLAMKMPVGASTYTGYFSLSGYNEYNVEYYGFSKVFGSWKVVDENGEPWTGDDAPVKLSNDSASGYPTIQAVKPGVCYLKYFIDEHTYNTSLRPDHYATNAELDSTAVIQVAVVHEHKLTRVPPKEATCTEKGNTVYWICDDEETGCQKIFSDAKGENEITAKETEVKALGHDWGDWEVTTAATERTEGTETRKCRRDGCDAEETRTIPPTSHIHKLTRIPPKEATCTEKGNTVYWICDDQDTGCQKIFSDGKGENEITAKETEVKALGHDWGDWKVTTAATEKSEGVETRKCQRDNCGSEETRTIPAASHSHKLTRIPPKEATCTEKGTTVYWICDDQDTGCGKMFSDAKGENEIAAKETEVKALGHDWGEWKVTAAATEKTKGTETRMCRHDGCNAKETRSIPQASHVHKLTRVPPKEAACTKKGNIVYWICKDGNTGCGKIFSDAKGQNVISAAETVIKAKGHKWDKGVVIKYPSTTAEGKVKHTCKTCGAVKTIVLGKLRAVNVYAKMSAEGKNSEVITWRKAAADGYMIYFAPCDTNDTYGTCKRIKIIRNNNTFKYTKTGLKKGKPYKAYVAAYKKVKGKRIVIGKSLLMHSVTGNASKRHTNPKTVSMKLNKITVAKGKKYVLKGQIIINYKKKLKLLGRGHDKKFRYLSTNKNIAKVSKKGVITGISKGTCTVHIVALNGVRKTITVTVR